MNKFLFLILLIGLGRLNAQINPTDGCPTTSVLTVNATCVNNTYFMSGGFTNGALIAPSCAFGSNRDDGWYSFVANAANITIEETSTDRDHLISVWPSCGSGTALGCDGALEDETAVLNLTGLTIGVTYFIQVQRRSGNGTSDMNGVICVYQTPNPDAAFPGASLGTIACGGTSTTSGNTTGATVHCTTSSAGDHIYNFTTTSNADVTVSLCGSSYDTELKLFSLAVGNCNGSPIETNDDACGLQSQLIQTCLTAGSYVVIVEGSGAATGAYTLSIQVNDCGCTGPPNDYPCTATPLAVNSTCTYTADNNTGATGSGIASPGCASYVTSDLWYSVTVPANGWLIFETSSGTMTDGGLAIYSGSCVSPTLIECNDDSGPGDMSEIERQDLTPGSTVYIRHWEFGGNFQGSYNICVHSPDCSGNTTNDFCEDAGTLFQSGGSSFASSTASLYTNDSPDNILSEFCGTIQNNSWYQFTATSTTHTFPVTAVVGCTNGIQAQVYEFIGGTGLCCHSFDAVSNCYNPGNTNLGTVTATGLTIGQSYILMIDGWAGANCDFAISGWTATNILPVEISVFDAVQKIDHNFIHWTTKSEINSKWFVVERSLDGINFEEITTLSAAGNSSEEIPYSYKDLDFNYPKIYYRLKEIDYDGAVQYSNTAMILRTELGISVYPNPTTGILNYRFYTATEKNYTIKYTDALGRVITEQILAVPGSLNYESTLLNTFNNGIYFVEIIDSNGAIIFQEKIIKK